MEPEGRAAQLTRAQDELSRVESEIARVGDMLAQDLGARSERAHGGPPEPNACATRRA